MEFFENFVAIPAFVVIIYLVAEIVKKIKGGALNTYIPIICGCCGAALGIVAFLVCPSYIMAENWFEAIAIGITSGLATTGINQVYKQLVDSAEK